MSYFNYCSKKIYYTEKGKGKPVLFLHGNTASSKMFEPLMPLYEDKYHVILIDFLGHGKSDRLETFPAELWIEEARQTLALLEHLKLGKVNLVGTSGGAWVAVNAALERPDLIDRVVADSFDGRTLAGDFSENLIKERTSAKMDEMSRRDFQEEYRAIAKETGADICVFSEGRHPAILSNAERAAEVIREFLK